MGMSFLCSIVAFERGREETGMGMDVHSLVVLVRFLAAGLAVPYSALLLCIYTPNSITTLKIVVLDSSFRRHR